MGLLDIWKEWRDGSYSPKGYEWGSQETDVDIGSSFPARTDLDTAGGSTYQGTKQKRGQFTTDPKYIRQNKEVRDRLGRVKKPGSPINAPGHVGHPIMNKQLPVQDASKTPNLYKDNIMQGGTGINTQNTEQLGFLQKLSNFIGTDYDKAVATWKDKGGFEGLMANPAFTMGLAFMQAGAEGKTLGQGALNNVIKAGGISQHYKKIIENRAGDVIEPTEGMMEDIKGVLGEMNISGPGWRKMLPGNQSASYEQAVEDITIKVQTRIKKMKKDAKASGKDIVVGKRLKKKIIQEMIDSGEINTKRVFFDKTLETKAEGGPVQAGKPYIVGEKGPEVIIPKSDGNVLANDDSQIFAMLLASNPQLQNVSRQRAERILRSRFPEYFEV